MITKIKPENFNAVVKVSGALIMCDDKMLLVKRSPIKSSLKAFVFYFLIQKLIGK